MRGSGDYEKKKKDTFRPEKKIRYSRLSDGCTVLAITTGKKKDTVVCLLGARFWRLRPEKKDTVVCLAGCAVVLFFVVAGNFDYDRKKKKIQSSVGGKLAVLLLWREIFITTEKKKRYITTGKKKGTDVCLMGAQFWRLRLEKKKIQSSVCWVPGSGDYDRKKKDTVVCLAGCAVVLCQFLVLAGN